MFPRPTRGLHPLMWRSSRIVLLAAGGRLWNDLRHSPDGYICGRANREVADEAADEFVLGREVEDPLIIFDEGTGLHNHRARDAVFQRIIRGKNGPIENGVILWRPRDTPRSGWIIEVGVGIDGAWELRATATEDPGRPAKGQTGETPARDIFAHDRQDIKESGQCRCQSRRSMCPERRLMDLSSRRRGRAILLFFVYPFVHALEDGETGVSGLGHGQRF